MLRTWILLAALVLCWPARAEWALTPVEAPPPVVAAAIADAREGEPVDPPREPLRWWRLQWRPDSTAHQTHMLLLGRDRGQRVWLSAADARLLARAPLGGVGDQGRVAARGLALTLAPESTTDETRWLAIEPVLGTWPRVAIESLSDYLARERSAWFFESTLSAALLTLSLMSLAFLWAMRDRVYLAYAIYLSMMLVSIWLRHSLTFRQVEALGIAPERVAAAGVLGSAIAAWGAVRLLRLASGIERYYPRIARWLDWASLTAIALAVIDLVTVVHWPATARATFQATNVVFGLMALTSGWALLRTVQAGADATRPYLLGWLPLVVAGTWFSLGSVVGLPQPLEPQRWILAVCAVQGLVWAGALAERALRLQAERDHAQELADVDVLTGLPNRRLLDRSIGTLPTAAVMICDLDHFKAINDHHGHAAGDRCLRHFAQCMREALAGQAQFGRWGGEEFLALLPQSEVDAVTALAERLRERTSATPVHLEGVDHTLTVSIGTAIVREGDVQGAIAAADQAMYRAKALGRNRVAAG